MNHEIQLDHGLPVDVSKQCDGKTTSGRRCKKHALVGFDTCFIHTPIAVRPVTDKDPAMRLGMVISAHDARRAK